MLQHIREAQSKYRSSLSNARPLLPTVGPVRGSAGRLREVHCTEPWRGGDAQEPWHASFKIGPDGAGIREHRSRARTSSEFFRGAQRKGTGVVESAIPE